ncbi:MAG: hypothetical protein GY846_09180 [Deltaproteobacteria bacterium]|nr:hypothetical protein [Deltaproteobacteria bacterium]
MKKIFILLSVLAALALTVVPSQALIGMPDDVPGSDILQGFFVVEVGATGLDTLVVFQEVLGIGGTVAAPTGNLHWIIRDRRSNHLADFNVPYSAHDVVGVSVRDLITDWVNDAGQTALTMTLNGTDYYIGYIEWENDSTWDTRCVGCGPAPAFGDTVTNFANNMIGKMLVIDTLQGKTSAVNLAAKEAMADAVTIRAAAPAFPYDWLAVQYQTYSPGDNTPADGEFVALDQPAIPNAVYEGFSAQSLAGSEQREATNQGIVSIGVVPGVNQRNYVAPTSFNITPRYYLFDTTNAENYIFLWKSTNDTNPGAATGLSVNVLVYDTDEVPVSIPLPLPDELNVINMRTWLPAARLAVVPCAGWIDIALNAANMTNFATSDFLGYNWQIASNANANLNWALLYQVPRNVTWPGKY